VLVFTGWNFTALGAVTFHLGIPSTLRMVSLLFLSPDGRAGHSGEIKNPGL
jgi:hypothetical protein